MSENLVSFVQAFTVDFFGSLLPGVLLLVGIYVGILYPIDILYCTWGTHYHAICGAIQGLHDQSTTTLGDVLALVVAYLIGITYSKRSVAWADTASYYYAETVDAFSNPRHHSPVTRPRKARQPPTSFWTLEQLCAYLQFKLFDSPRFAFGISVKDMPLVEFPYDDLRDYLKRIGLPNIARHIRWEPSSPDEHEFYRYAQAHRRVQRQHGMDLDNFNAIKTRIEISSPSVYRSIIQLEAQNRLLASTFYVATQVWLLILFFLIVLYVLMMTRAWRPPNDDLSALLLPLSASFVLCLFRHRILLTLHKERVREAVRVYESAEILGLLDVEEPPTTNADLVVAVIGDPGDTANEQT
ncbi:hypothetical protein LQG66_05570 [Bradyrhizobium ontarionense]|uniref:Uncharacterized protein n=1 Tax=Bradyrhizobium ontarionense TaxID=2898149 RepID=A0ABY3REQ4_9BRAD|nr:hypothetical protein [Bradyrhizobium sp. A19]UFZ05781.1 hypothetical protein LQG66_05570 [Bradyrhizobium sp. A19]